MFGGLPIRKTDLVPNASLFSDYNYYVYVKLISIPVWPMIFSAQQVSLCLIELSELHNNNCH